MTPSLGVLTEDDVAGALALGDALGWNKTADDWARIIRLSPAGCFAARESSGLVGTITTTAYGQTLAWIGMMIVRPDRQRQGIGTALMRRALEYLRGVGISTVKLDATPAGRPLYESLGFTVEAGIERWSGTAHTASAEAGPERGAVRSTPGGSPEILEVDRRAFGADRSHLIKTLLSECPDGPAVVASDAGTVDGYALARPGQTASYLGPVVATSSRVAMALIDAMARRFAGDNVCLDLHLNGLIAPPFLIERGLSKQRDLTRMSFGAASRAGASPLIAASAGPEFG